jgi:hypothetical protein
MRNLRRRQPFDLGEIKKRSVGGALSVQRPSASPARRAFRDSSTKADAEAFGLHHRSTAAPATPTALDPAATDVALDLGSPS